MSSQDASRDGLIGATIIGRYRVISRLAAGGMGVAYRAWDARAGVPVVVKLPRKILLADPKFGARFLREIRLLRGLSHPHIVPIVDVGEYDELPFFVMPFLPGGSLSHRRSNQPGMLHLWLPAVAGALDHIHSLPRPVVHRDVKPANVFFDAFWGAYLGDFGIAKVLAESDAPGRELTLTAANMGIGTPEYMAPEQFDPEATIDGRADQYSLAVLVYEMLAGSRPFTGTMADIVVAKRTQPAPALRERLPGLPASLAAAVHRGLAKQPGERFATCAEFAVAALRDVRPSDGDPGMARLLCPKCDSILTLPTSAAGQTGKCPKCQTRMQVADDLGAFWLLDEARPPRKAEGMATVRRTARKSRQRRLIVGASVLLVGVIAATMFLLAPGPKPDEQSKEVSRRVIENPADDNPRKGKSDDPPENPPDEDASQASDEPQGSPATEPVTPETPSPGPAEGTITVEPPDPEPVPAPKPPPYPLGDDVGVTVKSVFPRQPEEILAPSQFPNSAGIELKLIPAGERGTIEKSFYLGVTEVTNAQWNKVMRGRERQKDDDLPVENVTWEDANEFCEKLSAREDENKKGHVYRLPTEAEWEYACRAGTRTKFSFGNDDANLKHHGWFSGNTNKARPVHDRNENPWGLCDMHGNVWEWCSDWKKQNATRVIRGGSWKTGAEDCRSDRQGGWSPKERRDDIGFRVALSMPPLRNSIDIEFALIEPGSFTMGSGDGNPGDRPEHRVTITKPFCLGVTEVTNAQWKRVMAEAPPSDWPEDDKPVTNVTWADAVAFCARLSALPDERKENRVYRLPTEAEWEYACRAGTQTKFSFGKDDAGLEQHGWFSGNTKQARPVKQRDPNPWGLYDMHGNVWEWCSDWFGPYKADEQADPRGLVLDLTGNRVCRGGAYTVDAGLCGSATRLPIRQDSKASGLGFRLALSTDGSGQTLPAPVTLVGFDKAIGLELTFQVHGMRQRKLLQGEKILFDPGVWGGNPYTADSTLAAAVVHAGVVRPDEPGAVRVTILGKQQSDGGGTDRNGVTALRFPDAYSLWYRIETDGAAAEQPAGGKAVTDH